MGLGKPKDTVLILTSACARAGSALEPRLPAQDWSALGSCRGSRVVFVGAPGGDPFPCVGELAGGRL
jgi:hypothetical protein